MRKWGNKLQQGLYNNTLLSIDFQNIPIAHIVTNKSQLEHDQFTL